MIELVGIYAPLRFKYMRANESAFMNKKIKQEMMHRTKLKNIFLKYPSQDNELKYKRQRNYVVSIVRAAKKEYYSNLDIKRIADVILFRKTVKPSFTEKLKQAQNIRIVQNNEIIKEKASLVDLFNNYFLNVTTELGIINDAFLFQSHSIIV